MSDSNLTVLYHAPCYDGSVAATVLHEHYISAESRAALAELPPNPHNALGFPDPAACIERGLPVFYGIHPSRPPPDQIIAGRDVVIVDVSFGEPIFAPIAQAAASTVVLDHHDTSLWLHDLRETDDFPDWMDRVELHIDMAHCGAEHAWYYAASDELPPPPLLDYIAAGDLWLWEKRRADAREVHLALTTDGALATHAAIADALTWDAGRFGALATVGACYMDARARRVAAACARARPVTLRIGQPAAGEDWGTSGPHLTALLVEADADQSFVGEALCARPLGGSGGPLPDCALVVGTATAGGTTMVSMRAGPHSALQLGRIARALPGTAGGGGHPRAAGFSFIGAGIAEYAGITPGLP